MAQLAAETKQALADTVAGYSHADEMLAANADNVDRSVNRLAAAAKSGMFGRFTFFFFSFFFW